MDKMIDEIRPSSTTIQTNFIMGLAKLCNTYGVDKNKFIRDTMSELHKFILTSDFTNLV